MRRTTVGIEPAGEHRRRARLFGALEELHPIRFADGCAGASACVTFGSSPPPGRVKALSLVHDEQPTEGAASISLSAEGVDQRLSGRVLEERWVGDARLPEVEGQVLASCGGGALWTRRGDVDTAALAPLELAPEEPLRDRLHPGRWLALLPLFQFLRSVAGDAEWAPPPPRATFLFDDPNLHWTSYGFLRFSDLAAAAREHEYHAAFATIPIDAWFTHPAAAKIFRESPGQLSLLMHGNDHLAKELARPLDERSRYALLGQALRRVEALERRSGVPVSRVMAAPHGVCSEEMARAMLALDFEGLTISRPYPWLARPPAHWLASPPGTGPSVGMRPTELVTGGLPVLLRTTLQHGEDDLLLRAFLDQPMIVSGHHDDLSTGLTPLATIAASINRIEGVRWGSLTDIARASFASKVEDGVMRIRPYGRVLSVEPPAGVEALAVEAPADTSADRLLVGGADAAFGQPMEVGGGRQEIRITRRAPVDRDAVPSRHVRPWPVARRIVAEGRDRLRPLLGAR